MRKILVGGAAAFGALVGAAEAVNRLAARSALAPPDSAPRVAVVVLGYPSRPDGSPHPVQRQRVEAGIRALRRHGVAVMVMSGGAVRNEHAEAETMVALAAALGVDGETLVAETRSRTTWENVRESASLVDDDDIVVIASEPLHAARARRYWIKQRPADVDRVFVAAEQRRLFDHWWLTTPSVLYELAIAIQDRVRFND